MIKMFRIDERLIHGQIAIKWSRHTGVDHIVVGFLAASRASSGLGARGTGGAITYLGVFASGGRQSSWIRNGVETDGLLALIENGTAERVLACIGSGERLRLLLAILQKPQTVAELVKTCGFGSTGR